MNVICTKCGGTKVSCEAMIDPNTKEFHNYTDESFQYGWCGKCGHGTVLTDTDEVKEEIDRIYQRYVEEKKEEPKYAVCVIVWKDDNNSELVNIRLSSDNNPDEDDGIFFYCDGLSGLKSLCEFGGEDFIVTEIHYLEKCCNG
ncbi:hypothetical protein [Xylanibacter rodentium]|jgi:hypothetical protein|uniref:hypothetical protein n=1 Tax=Xylanibacter rodentium TaxID=2736289 RepID=UPI00256EC7B5|nr:hypothetical protein [Xylanibacter rodentium]